MDDRHLFIFNANAGAMDFMNELPSSVRKSVKDHPEITKSLKDLSKQAESVKEADN